MSSCFFCQTPDHVLFVFNCCVGVGVGVGGYLLNARKTSAAREKMEQKARRLLANDTELRESSFINHLKAIAVISIKVVAFVFTRHFFAKSRTCKLFNRD